MITSIQSPAYDLFSPNSYLSYGQIEADPVYYLKSLGYWIMTQCQDVEASLKDERLSSDRTALFHQLGDLDIGLIQNFQRRLGNMMLEKDPPVHTQKRKLGNQGFTHLELLPSVIEEIV